MSHREIFTQNERKSTYMNAALRGNKGLSAWVSAVYRIAAGQIPGESYESEHLQFFNRYGPEVLCDALVDGALKMTRERFDDGVENVSGVALVTALVWSNRKPPEIRDTIKTEMFARFDRVSTTLQTDDKKADFEIRLWKLVQKGLSEFPDYTIRNGFKQKISRDFLKSRLIHMAESEFEKNDMPVTAAMMKKAVSQNRNVAISAFREAASEIFQIIRIDEFNDTTYDTTRKNRAWKHNFIRIATTLSQQVEEPNFYQDLLLPMLLNLDYREDELRMPIVEEIVRRYTNREKKLLGLITQSLTNGRDFRFAVLLMRAFSPDDKKIQRLLSQLHNNLSLSGDITVELALLYAWWEGHARTNNVRLDMDVKILNIINLKEPLIAIDAADILRYAPRHMTLNGALRIIEKGLISTDPDVIDSASIGLLTTIATRVQGPGFLESGVFYSFLKKYAKIIPTDRFKLCMAMLNDQQ